MNTNQTNFMNPDAQTAVIEIRSYTLQPGTRENFHKLMTEQALPMLRRWNIDVLGNGPSLQEDSSYYLVRAYKSLEDRQREEDAFYGSDEWRKGPREAILAPIIHYTTVIIPADSLIKLAEDIKARRRPPAPQTSFLQSSAPQTSIPQTSTPQTPAPQTYAFQTPASPAGNPHSTDRAELSALNRQFIENFLNQDVSRHEEIIHKDFICIEPDGSIVNREEYMKNWATGYRTSGYTSFSYTDEVIRIFGNMALVRSKTVYTKNVDGKPFKGNSIYTDTYVKENGTWKCVQAQLTRVSG